jgi:hypothetical protein
MNRFRKKPVEIEARQFDKNDSGLSLLDWCGGEVFNDAVDGTCILINTPEGQMKAVDGDWIIKGVKGEFYPCKPDIFAATYEAV